MDKTQIPVGRRLRALREHHGLTQVDLGELAGVHHTTINKLESGVTPYVHETTAQALADALYVEVRDLFDSADITTKGKPIGTTTSHYDKGRAARAACPSCHLELLPCGLCPSECSPRHTDHGDGGRER